MNNKLLRCLKRLVLFFSGASLVVIVLFFIFIAPRRTLPILMYHAITCVEQENILNLPTDIFRRQMQHLSKHNYYVASLTEVAQLIREGERIPKNWVVLTFDDGHKDFYSQVYPLLKNEQFKATVFVIVNSLDKGESSLNWLQVQDLSKDNLIDFGAHTLTHRMLPLLDLEQAREEIFLSKQILETRLKEAIDSFCYPYGALNDSTKKLVKNAGYQVAVGTAYQRGEFKDNDIYILKRVFVSKFSRFPLVFRFMLSGYYVPTRELALRILNIKTPRDFYRLKDEKAASRGKKSDYE